MRDNRIRDSIPNLVAKLFRQTARVHGRAVGRFEISAVQANILAVLWLEGSMTIGELQAALALGSSTLTGAVDRMERANLVKRVEVHGDRRAWRLEPAPWPAKKREALIETLAETERRCFVQLTAAERKQLAVLLEKAIASISAIDRGAAGEDSDG
jgi:MarR family transcriptional regulator, organic hydroperoxide resistance regulator